MERSSCKFGDDGEEMESEMCLKKMQDQSSMGDAQSHALPKQLLRTSSAASTSIFCISDVLEHIKVGSFYQIDHTRLSYNSPEQLRSIRVVMVSEKAEINVSLRFPSVDSLRTFFKTCGNPNAKMLPALNEKYIMSSDLAEDVLYRRISSKEIAEKKNFWSFWTTTSVRDESYVGLVSTKRFCTSELNLTGMLQWGKRQHFKFLNQQHEEKFEALSRSAKEGDEERNFDEEEDKEATDSDEEAVKIKSFGRENLKRKDGSSTAVQKKNRRPIQVPYQGKRRDLKKSISRWSVDRYNLAEENMLKILKAKGAVFGNPILRPSLRAEARKLIGDTGLLDHLLKHMAGKVAPGGTDRFRRRHNADGAMEYWLESADLVNIRKEAGVEDPYWTPQPGWKLGDNPTQDPICAREIEELKANMARMQEDILVLMSTKHEQSSVAITPNSSVLILSSSQEDCLRPPKEIYTGLLKGKAKIEGQLMEISKYLCYMEEQMGILKPGIEEQNMSESEEAPPLVLELTLSDTGKDKKEEDEAAKFEDKAAKIQRLKSGFRICKPQGTFLWPNMALSPLSQLDDPLVVPTPPSASSTSATPIFLSPPDQQLLGPHPTSPLVKPLARLPISSSIYPNATILPPPLPPSQTIISSKTSLLNLNDDPFAQNSVRATLTTYQRKNCNATSNPDPPLIGAAKKENEAGEKEGSSSSASSTASWVPLPTKEGWRLALSTPHSSLNYSKSG